MDFKEHITGIKAASALPKRPELGLNVVPVILAGGQGKRLRPLTSHTRPKPFLRPFSKYSLLQETVKRCAGLSAPVIVCHHHFAMRALEELAAIDRRPGTIIAEPAPRSTAIAIAMAALCLERSSNLMLVQPSDHFIAEDGPFREAVASAASYAADGGPVFLGVRADKPKTRYGYIETRPGDQETLAVTGFVEKPAAQEARILYAREHVFWNTGIFMARPAAFLDLLQNKAPRSFEAARKAYEQRSEDDPFLFPDFDSYISAPAVSVDYAVMEHCKNAHLVPLKTEWTDIGCWPDFLRVKIKNFLDSF